MYRWEYRIKEPKGRWRSMKGRRLGQKISQGHNLESVLIHPRSHALRQNPPAGVEQIRLASTPPICIVNVLGPVIKLVEYLGTERKSNQTLPKNSPSPRSLLPHRISDFPRLRWNIPQLCAEYFTLNYMRIHAKLATRFVYMVPEGL